MGITKQTIFWVLFLLAFLVGAYEALMLLIQYTQNPVIVGVFFYLAYLAIFVLGVFILNYVYIYRFRKGKPLMGIMSLGFKHLTDSQSKSMGEKALAYEIVILRMDALIPATIFFSILLFTTLPSQITSIPYTEAFILVSILESTYVLSYIIYVLILATLMGWKYKDKQFGLVDLENILTPSLLSGVNDSVITDDKNEG
jgi:hypothetical protein